jgi:hypothetical protein
MLLDRYRKGGIMGIGKGVPVMLDKERHLKLDLNAMVRFEEATGKSFLKGFDTDNLTAKGMLSLFWACLLHEDPALTQEQVGSWIDATNMTALSDAMNKAISVSLPEKKETVDPNAGNLPTG